MKASAWGAIGWAAIGVLMAAIPLQAQESFSILGIELSQNTWCQDSGTYCWKEDSPFLAGIRFVAEPKLGRVLTRGANRIESEGMGSLTLAGVELNLFRAVVAAQGSVTMPGRVTLDDQSPLRLNGRLQDADGDVDVDFGWNLGLSFLDGAFSVGHGTLYLDERDILEPTAEESKNGYWYVNLQSISAVRSIIKRNKP